MAYADSLRHPKWQRKRLEVMQRDNFECQHCGEDETTLNVHHLVYGKGMMPWEYHNDYLITLCEPCHEFLESSKKEIGFYMKDRKQMELYRQVSMFIYCDRFKDCKFGIGYALDLVCSEIMDYDYQI